MSESVIVVEKISKKYRLGVNSTEAATLSGQLVDAIKAPFRNFKRLKNLSNFDADDSTVFWALKDVSFEIKRGEVIGIIGHNGAGKSTLLKIMSRITEPTSGQISIKGRIASLLEVGTGFHPELTGRENVYMNGTILGMSKKEIDKKLDEIIAFSGIEKHVDTPVKFYSSGMKVRLGFSVAAHLEPEILIIDEVLAVGDMDFQRKCLGKMEDVAGAGRTVLFVSHNMDSINNLCARSILMNAGRVAYDGDTKTSIEKYLGVGHVNELSVLKRTIVKDKPFFISEVSVVDSRGEVASNPLQKGKEYYLKVIINSEKDIPKAHLSYEIVNALNVRIFYSDYTDSSRTIAGLQKGKNTIQVKLFTEYLLSGDYFIHFQLGDLITFENDHTKSILSFYMQGPDLMKTNYRGIVQDIYTWEL